MGFFVLGNTFGVGFIAGWFFCWFDETVPPLVPVLVVPVRAALVEDLDCVRDDSDPLPCAVCDAATPAELEVEPLGTIVTALRAPPLALEVAAVLVPPCSAAFPFPPAG